MKNEQRQKDQISDRSNKTKTGKAHREAQAPVPFERAWTHDPNSKDPSIVRAQLWEETRYADPIRHPEPVHRPELETRLEAHRAGDIIAGASVIDITQIPPEGHAPPPNDQLLMGDLVYYLSTQAEAALGTGER